jgi:hypothetical protein
MCIDLCWPQARVVSGPFSICGQQLASLASGAVFGSLPCSEIHWSLCTALCDVYNGMLTYLLPGGIAELSGAERAGELPASYACVHHWYCRMYSTL